MQKYSKPMSQRIKGKDIYRAATNIKKRKEQNNSHDLSLNFFNVRESLNWKIIQNLFSKVFKFS